MTMAECEQVCGGPEPNTEEEKEDEVTQYNGLTEMKEFSRISSRIRVMIYHPRVLVQSKFLDFTTTPTLAIANVSSTLDAGDPGTTSSLKMRASAPAMLKPPLNPSER